MHISPLDMLLREIESKVTTYLRDIQLKSNGCFFISMLQDMSTLCNVTLSTFNSRGGLPSPVPVTC